MNQSRMIILFLYEERTFFIVGLVCLICCLILTRLLMSLKNKSKKSKAELNAARLRSTGEGSSEVRVRQTDIVERMDKQDRMIHAQADRLEQEGKYLEAASLFESIKFQRRAIDILEKHGYIEQACEILMRLNSPGRAAIICERNQKNELAAKYYVAAGQTEKAGNALLRLAGADYHFYERAAVLFEKTSHVSGLLRCYGPLLQTQKILEICYKEDHYDFLVEYMRDPVNARGILPSLNEHQLASLFDAIVLSPQTVQTVINWIYYVPDQRLYQLALRFAGKDIFMCRLFWQMANVDLAEHLYSQLLAVHQWLGPEIAGHYLQYFESSQQVERAAQLAQTMGQYVKAALLKVAVGDLVSCRMVLQSSGEEHLIHLVDEILKEQPIGPWSVDQLARAKHFLEKELRPFVPADLSQPNPKVAA